MDGDEDDGYDEVIYPVDFRQVGHIVDDEMHDILVKPLQLGTRLTAIFDSCHSGSALDLPYIYSTHGVLKEPNLAKEAGQGLLGLVSSYARGDMGGMASTAMSFFKKATTGDDVYKRNLQTKTSPADVVMWSGSKDSQTSSDASIAGQATGAMSWAFITALKKNPQQSYVQLLNSIRDELEGNYDQKPQLSCSHPLGKSTLSLMERGGLCSSSALIVLSNKTNDECRHETAVRNVRGCVPPVESMELTFVDGIRVQRSPWVTMRGRLLGEESGGGFVPFHSSSPVRVTLESHCDFQGDVCALDLAGDPSKPSRCPT